MDFAGITISIEEQKTYHIVYEILETERSYVKKLRYLAKVRSFGQENLIVEWCMVTIRFCLKAH